MPTLVYGCANCGEPIRRTEPHEGIAPDIEWTHNAGGPLCDNGYLDEDTMEWHDPSWAVWPHPELIAWREKHPRG